MNYVKTYFLDIITKHFFDFDGKENRNQMTISIPLSLSAQSYIRGF